MPRSQPYDPSFSYDLGEGYLMNPRSGEIFNTANNTVYADYNELGMEIQTQSAGMNAPQQGSSKPNIAGLGSTAATGLSGYSALTGGGAAATGAGSTAVGSSVTGGTMLANGTVAPMTAGGYGAGAGGAGLGAGAAIAAPAVGTPLWAYSMSQSVPNAYRDAEGKGLASGTYDAVKPSKGTDYAAYVVDPFFTPQIMAGVGAIGSLFGSSKAKEKATRKDGGRRRSQDLGLMEQDSRSMWNQYDGNRFDIRDYKAKTGQDAYNIDFNQEIDPNDIGFLDALGYAQYGGKANKDGTQNKLISDMTGEMYNAGKNSGDIKANNRYYGDKLGGAQVIKETIAQRWRDGKITAQQRDAGFAATDKEYGILNPNNQRWEDGAALDEKDIKRNQEELGVIPKAPMGKPSSASSGYTTKPLPVNGSAGFNTSSTGGRPATPVNTGTYRPGASTNPNFKNQPYKIPKKK
jgi:hypothetical protein